ncbi:hypothetical protein thalar_03438 [Litoreibacter arenae DSM 19593]|uniref:Uncharacterized protein n=1 Tax=Litoreibacter arenae DSM 19593 TaxID=1123360 RepID=S9QDQ5_9RHOB|nr:hypothetical protein thalar_03438 [Litoreibacter arenae DSM 19593]
MVRQIASQVKPENGAAFRARGVALRLSLAIETLGDQL